MDTLKKNFGMRIKELRKSKNYTQEQLAEIINMDTPNLCKMENGSHFPQTKNLAKLAIALDVEVKELFDFEHLKPKSTLISYIIDYAQNANQKELQFLYKVITGIKEFHD